jgi:hypothetical protein
VPAAGPPALSPPLRPVGPLQEPRTAPPATAAPPTPSHHRRDGLLATCGPALTRCEFVEGDASSRIRPRRVIAGEARPLSPSTSCTTAHPRPRGLRETPSRARQQSEAELGGCWPTPTQPTVAPSAHGARWARGGMVLRVGAVELAVDPLRPGLPPGRPWLRTTRRTLQPHRLGPQVGSTDPAALRREPSDRSSQDAIGAHVALTRRPSARSRHSSALGSVAKPPPGALREPALREGAQSVSGQ